jgi:hypothetical protein
VATLLLKLVRALHAQERQSLLNLARCASVAGALSVAGPALADSDRPDLENGTGDDPTEPLGKIELLDRYTETPGPGVAEGTIKSVETNTPTACFREGRPTIISIARLGWRKRSRIPSKITRLLMPESAPTHLAKVGGEGSNPGVDFGFNVGLAEFEKSTCCWKRVPRHFRFQSRLRPRFFSFNWDWLTA